MLFAGRLVPEKNPVFAVDVLSELLRMKVQAFAVFAGAGSEEHAVAARAGELGISNSVRLLGWRGDLPEIMGCEVIGSSFRIRSSRWRDSVLPSLKRSLAGLRMLLSCGIADDPLLPSASFRRLPLSTGPKAWAEAAIDLSRGPMPSRVTALAALRKSPADMDKALDALVGFHI